MISITLNSVYVFMYYVRMYIITSNKNKNSIKLVVCSVSTLMASELTKLLSVLDLHNAVKYVSKPKR